MRSELKVLEKGYNYLQIKYEKLTKECAKFKEEKKHALAEHVDAKNDHDNLLKRKKDLCEMCINAHADFGELNNGYEGLQINHDEATHALCNVQNDLRKKVKASKVQNKESKDRCKSKSSRKSN